MGLFKLRIEVPDLATGEAVAAIVEASGEGHGEALGEAPAGAPAPLAVTLFEVTPPRFVVEAYFSEPPDLGAVRARLAAGYAALTATGAVPPVLEPVVEAVPEQSWVALSQASLPPIAAGRVVIHGSHDRARFGLRRLAVEIDAGEAFGSGHNATTALCVEALDRLARQRRLRRVLDLGCGSGVLGIAAARLAPAAQVIASDNDPIAVAVARENARLNRVSGRLRVLQASSFAHPVLRRSLPFDLVLANILPGPLIALAPRLRRAIAGGGTAVLSGLLDHQAPEVAAAYAASGFHRLRRLTRGGWTALVMVRR